MKKWKQAGNGSVLDNGSCRSARLFVVLTIVLHVFAHLEGMDSSLLTPGLGDAVSTKPAPEYPRPMLKRPDWMQLNGLWDFGYVFWKKTNVSSYTRQIRVPYPAESRRSGTGYRLITEAQRLWYRRTFAIPVKGSPIGRV